MTQLIQEEVVLLQYPKLGELGPYGKPVDENTADKFVNIDGGSGYPYHTSIHQAYQFKTIEAAEAYRKHFPTLQVRYVKITYEIE